FRPRDKDLIVPGINLRHGLTRLDELVVFYQELFNVSANPRAERIQMPVDLRIVGGLVTVEIAPEKEAGDENYDHPDDYEHPQPGTARAEFLPLQVTVGQGWTASLVSFRGMSLSWFCHESLAFQVLSHALLGKPNGSR